MCSEHHCPGVGACALRAGDGPGAPLHDQEGPHQHWCAGSETASASWKILLCESAHLHLILTQKFIIYLIMANNTSHIFITSAEECYRHRCWGFRFGCSTAAAELWHSGNYPLLKLVLGTHLLWPPVLPCSLVTVLVHTALHSSFSLVYRWWCLRQGRELEVVYGMILLWASQLGEELRLSMAV